MPVTYSTGISARRTGSASKLLHARLAVTPAAVPTDHRTLRICDPRREQAVDGGSAQHVLVGLGGQQHELPAAVTAAPWNHGGLAAADRRSSSRSCSATPIPGGARGRASKEHG